MRLGESIESDYGEVSMKNAVIGTRLAFNDRCHCGFATESDSIAATEWTLWWKLCVLELKSVETFFRA